MFDFYRNKEFSFNREPRKESRKGVFQMERTPSHTKWDCKYHIVFIPKYRKKVLYGQLREYVGDILRMLVRQKECEILEGHACVDHIHILISIPPKHSVSSVVGFIKGKSAIYIARNFLGRKMNFGGQSFWARGYYVSTSGRDEKVIREYIRRQERADQEEDARQMELFNNE
jgi:putative transposase